MLQLQDGIKQIFSSSPQNLYFFTGPEYGVKREYIDTLSKNLNYSIENHTSVLELIDTFSQKSLIPRNNAIFVVRYDKKFITELSHSIADRFKSLRIPGIIIGIYGDDKDEAKLDKYFPNNTLRVNLMSPEISFKHLIKKFRDLGDVQIKYVVELSEDYFQAEIMCSSLLSLPKSVSSNLSKKDIFDLFNCDYKASTDRFRECVASKNFKAVLSSIEAFDRDISNLFYEMLNVYLEIIKCLEKKYSDSYVTKYLKLWDINSAKFMFLATYDQIEKLRNYSKYSEEIALMYLVSLMQYKIG